MSEHQQNLQNNSFVLFFHFKKDSWSQYAMFKWIKSVKTISKCEGWENIGKNQFLK